MLTPIMIRGRLSISRRVLATETELIMSYEIRRTNSCVACYVDAKNMHYPRYHLLVPSRESTCVQQHICARQ